MSFENVWYLPSSNTWKDFQLMAMKDIGNLKVSPGCLIFSGSNYDVVITDVLSISYGKQGRDFINNWVKVEYIGKDNAFLEAYTLLMEITMAGQAYSGVQKKYILP